MIQCVELESRVLYSAAPIDLQALEPISDTVEQEFTNASGSELTDLATFNPTVADRWISSHDESQLAATDFQIQTNILDGRWGLTGGIPDGEVESVRQEWIIVDRNVENYESLIADLTDSADDSRQFTIHFIDRNQDGIDQISQLLSGVSSLDAIHILSHGNSNAVQLGSNWLSQLTINRYASDIARWSLALTADADMLFYGCNLAATEQGLELIESFAELTGADIAASDNLTGHAALGGDWVLEFNHGQVETGIVFTAAIQNTWLDTLATFTVNSGADDGSAGTLRWAIDQANTSGGFDIIDFDLGPGYKKITPQSQLDPITETVLIDGWSKADFAGVPLIELKGDSAGGGADGLIIQADNVEIRGLIVNRFGDDGIVVNGDNNLIRGVFIGTNDAGTTGLVGNSGDGIYITGSSNTIGGTGANDGNIISANGQNGIFIDGDTSDDNRILGNYIGLDFTGETPLGNGLEGIRIDDGDANIIGGNTSAARNVISGNGNDGIMLNSGASLNTIIGNYIGTDKDGEAAIGNGYDGIEIINSDTNTIGGTNSNERNVISGNAEDGIGIIGAGSFDNVILGNYIGLSADGTQSLANGYNGVWISQGAHDNIVGGSVLGAGNVISGNDDDGVEMQDAGTTGNRVLGNIIGLDPTGTFAIGNGDGDVPDYDAGIVIENASGNFIGGTSNLERNIIAGNLGSGIIIGAAGATGNTVYNNYIGVLADGVTAMGNSRYGILITDDIELTPLGNPSQNVIGGVLAGMGNLIAHNTLDGVRVVAGDRNSIRGNRFISNGGLAIDLNGDGVSGNDGADGDGGANLTMNYPVLASAKTNFDDVIVTGTLDTGIPTANIDLDFYWNTADDPSGHGEAENYIDSVSVTTDGSGLANFTVILNASVPDGVRLTATATDPQENTSEFALNIDVTERLNIDLPAPQLSWDVGDGKVLIDPDAVLNNPEAIGWNGWNLTVDFPVGGTAFEQLTIFAPGTDGNLSVQSGTNVRYHSGGSPTHFGTIISDGSNGTPLIINFNSAATDLMVERLLQSIEFENTQGPPPDSMRTVQFVLSDGGSNQSNIETEQIRVGPANDPPSVTIKNPSITYTENDPPLLIDDSLNVTDSDSPTLEGATFHITSGFAAGQDFLRWDATVAVANGITVVYDSSTGILTLSGAQPDTNYEAVLQTVKYENISDDPSTTDRVVTLTVDDGFDPSSDTRTIKVVAQNDAPVVDLDADDSIKAGLDYETTWSEGLGPVLIVDTDALVRDVDNTQLISISVTITNRLDGASEVLAADTTGTSLTATFNSGSGVLTIDNGGSPVDTAEFEQVLRTITYDNLAASPDASANRLIDFVANDGNDDSLTATAEVYLSKSLGLWMSTSGDSTTGAPGLLSGWLDSEIIQIADPNLRFEPTAPAGTTDGDFSSVVDIGSSDAKKLTALHFVSRDITIGSGASTFDLRYGDVLGSTKSPSTILGLPVDSGDIWVFRPNDVNDYTLGGTSFMLLENVHGDGKGVTALTLVEQDTTVGDVLLKAGEFLISKSSTGSEKNDIFYFAPTAVGGSTSGAYALFIEGDDLDIVEQIEAIELVETTTVMGGTTLPGGSIILSVDDNDSGIGTGAGGITVTAFDLFYIELTTTNLGSPAASGTATFYFDGSDVNLTEMDGTPKPVEDPTAIAIYSTESSPWVPSTPANLPPTDISPDSFSINENIVTSGGINLGTLSATDPDTAETFSYSILAGGDGAAFSIGGAGSDELIFDESLIDDGWLDFEDRPSYSVNVRVTDSASNTYDETLVINVNDLNESPFVTNPLDQVSVFVSAPDVAIDLTKHFGDPEQPATDLIYTVTANSNPGIVGTSIDLATDTLTLSFPAGVGFSDITVEARDSSGLTASSSFRAYVNPYGELWFSTQNQGDVAPQQTSGLLDWDLGEVIGFGDPNLNYLPVGSTDDTGTTSGQFSYVFDLNEFTNSGNEIVDAMHFVGSSITVGQTSPITLNYGDLLLSTSNSALLEWNAGASTMNVGPNDIFVFRPDTAGDYSSGSFFLLLNNLGTTNVHAISMVEQDTTVGGPGFEFTLTAGSFIYADEATPQNIRYFDPDSVGATTTALTDAVLIAGSDINLSEQIDSLELIEQTVTIGNVTLQQGWIIASMALLDGNVGDLTTIFNVESHDLFYLDVVNTEIVTPGGSAVNAYFLFDGSDVGLSTAAEDVISLTLAPRSNSSPTDISPDSFAVAENTDTTGGVSLGTLTTTDPDTGESFTYSILAGGDGAAFSIGGAGSDELIFDESLIDDGFIDYEDRTSYSVTVQVMDSASNTYSETLTVNVTDVAATITPGQSFNVGELDPNGTPVGTVASSGDDAATFNIIGGNTGGAFAIDNSGNITVANAAAIDFESSNSFSLTVEVSDGTTTTNETVTVNVNDVATTITPGQNFSVGELDPNSTPVGSVATTGDATSTFNITAGNTGGAFAIDNSGNITVANSAAIDFESSNSFTLTVEVSDGTTTTNETVTINVNDVAATITPGQNFSVGELDPNSTPVGSVATTGDATSTFNITAGNTGGAFAIDNSGNITVANAAAIDFESSNSFSLTVEVSDGTTTTSESVAVNVNDVDVTIDPGQTRNVSEAAPNGTFVGAPLATSGDAASTFTIIGGNSGGAFAIDNTGQLTVANSPAIDFEFSSSFTLTIAVGDGTTTTSETVNVSVLDADVTIDPGQTFNIGELDGNGTAVGTVSVNGDPAIGFNIIGGNTGGAFTIDNAGNITVANANAVDFESSTSFTLTIEVTDGTTTTNETVTINVSDVPTNITAGQLFNVGENDPAGTSVGTVATTGDAASTFNITGGNVGGAFAIDNSGNLTVANDAAIDFEVSSSFTLTIDVSDGTTTASETVTISVIDQNDSPMITSDGGGPTATINVPENTTVVTTVTASDQDAADTLTYNIIGGVDQSHFMINSATGVLTFATPPDFESPGDSGADNTYVVQVSVTDTAGDSDVQTITVAVTNVNDPPVATIVPIAYGVNENAPPTPLGGISVSDPDVGTNNMEVTVSVINGRVTLVNLTGLLVTGGSNGSNTVTVLGSLTDLNNALSTLRYQPNPGFSGPDLLTLFVDDLGNTGGGSLTDSDSATITVNPVANTPPTTSGIPDLTVDEDSIDRFVDLHPAFADAEDSDTALTYTINGNTNPGLFDSVTINATDQIQFDFRADQFGFSRITVRATDTGGLFVETTFRVTVNPVNDEQSLDVNAPLTVNEGGSSAFSTAELSTSDIEQSAAQVVYTINSGPAHGTVLLSGSPTTTFTQDDIDNNRVTYLHDGSEVTSDHFDFEVDDGFGSVTNSTFDIDVAPINDAPLGGPDAFATTIDSPLSASGLLSNDSDVDSGSLTSVLNSPPSHGTVTLSPTGAFIYTPAAGFAGIDSFTYVVDDGTDTSAPVTVLVNVIGGKPSTSDSVDEDKIEVKNTKLPIQPLINAESDLDKDRFGREPPSVPLVSLQLTPHGYIQTEPLELELPSKIEIKSLDFALNTDSIPLAGQLFETIARGRMETDLSFLADSGWFWQALDQLGKRMESEANIPQILLGGTAAIASSLSVGYVIWLIRGGQVMAALMAHLPAWKLIDPLPIVSAVMRDDEEDDSLQSMIDDASDDESADSADHVDAQMEN